jgi:hypothetical protein
MKNLRLFLSMDAGLVTDTRLIYPLKIAESPFFLSPSSLSSLCPTLYLGLFALREKSDITALPTARCRFFSPSTSHHHGGHSKPVVMVPLHNPG